MATRSTLSLEEFARLPQDNACHELDRGELIVSPPPTRRHGKLQSKISRILGNFVEAHALGETMTESGFVLAPDTVRGPDVAFIRKDRLASLDESATWPAGAPDLAIEIVSPSDTAAALERKTGQYLSAGAQAFWFVYPETRSVHVFEPGGAVRVLDSGAILEAPGLLPGFSIRVGALFE